MRRFLCLLACLTNVAQAEISINSEQLSINDGLYNIPQELGQTVGSNLFHSFDRFNLNAGETAQFIGSEQIQNVISRVIGGEPSLINGTIRSLMPNANFYFLNPNGIVFGESAQIQVPSSFHVSTADYVKLSDGGEFHARIPEQDILTIAPIESFGFLDNAAASIQINDAQLAVAPTKTLSLVGGDIQLTNTTPTIYDEASQHQFTHQLLASSGQIILDSKGDINLNNFGVDTSGVFGGQITIRGKDLTLNDSRISSHTIGELDGQSIDIQVENLTLQDSDIIANTYGAGLGSQINLNISKGITATQIDRPTGVEFNAVLNGSSHVMTQTIGQGNIGAGGDITVQAKNINLSQGAAIWTQTFSLSKSGDISVQVEDSIQATGLINFIPELVPIMSGIQTSSFVTGISGSINIHTKNISIEQGASIAAGTVNAEAGNVSIQAEDVLVLGQMNGVPSSVSSISVESGQSGLVEVYAQQIMLKNGGIIGNTTFGTGNTNHVIVSATEQLTVSGIASEPYNFLNYPKLLFPSNINSATISPVANAGNASDIFVQAKHLVLENGGSISSLTFGGGNAGNADIIAETIDISNLKKDILLFASGIDNSSMSTASYAGQAGNITVTANQITVQNQGVISTSAVNAGGGNISLNIRDALYLFDKSSITTSVQSGLGDGGNISIDAPQFLVLNHSPIIAQANAGQGGNIRIVADQFLKSPNSLVSASSRLGIDGSVKITSPDETISTGLLHLNKSFAEQIQIKDVCKAAIAGQLPTEFQPPLTFKVNMYRFSNDFVDDWIPSSASRLRLSICK
ncbi:filamentous hemagglutinin N-terminal domain-containing protein [Candidatus Albibeggiatoa sp. nov. NOAA]|uniref:two-partner secretion domain-containing protein n=1 Tax=Candidatus Albibeggiatoa sp. nov. NOAA TaxID=3162724 RepID=UPI0032F1D43A|nr:filamentous hemagglutinin N-terminal domain-containing protein [Thiotrichaceae bacterium]